MIDSRSSGKAAERKDDVRVPADGDKIGISFEVKTRRKLPKQLKDWYMQACKNNWGKNIPVVVLKEKNTEWKDALIVLRYEHFLRYMIYFFKEEK